MNSKIKPVEWTIENKVRLIDQTKIPYSFETIDISNYKEMIKAIKDMIVRGAPAIGISGGSAVALASMEIENIPKESFLSEIKEIAEEIKSARPTAVNLMWAVDKQVELIENIKNKSNQEITAALIENAKKLIEEDIQINKKIGDFGAEVVLKGATILTHCNAGALATAGYGTALGVVRSAFERDNTIQVFADETRPRMQGGKLTVWELLEDGIPTTVITDGMSGYFMKKGMIDMVVVGADRIAANGDTANKIGTYTLAIAAKYHNVPFYIAAPLSTIDISIQSGIEIPIEEREKEEVTHINGHNIYRSGVNVINPSFDVTPAELIAGIITEKGILRPDYKKSIAEAFKKL